MKILFFLFFVVSLNINAAEFTVELGLLSYTNLSTSSENQSSVGYFYSPGKGTEIGFGLQFSESFGISIHKEWSSSENWVDQEEERFYFDSTQALFRYSPFSYVALVGGYEFNQLSYIDETNNINISDQSSAPLYGIELYTLPGAKTNQFGIRFLKRDFKIESEEFEVISTHIFIRRKF